MAKTQRVVGQVLLAVGGVMAVGGAASFVMPNVELRALSAVVSSVEGRLIWIAITASFAVVGLVLLRGTIKR